MKCKVCGGSKHEKLFVVSGKVIQRCEKCGVSSTKDFRKPNYSKYHRDEDYKQFDNHFKNIFEKRVDIVCKFHPDPGRVLEIGSSTGNMLLIFKQRGWEGFGVEPSGSGMVAKEKGIETIQSEFLKAKLRTGFFDVVILNHTFEHLENPRETLARIRKVLKKEGLVVIDVPNFGSLSSELFGARWKYLLPQEHVYHYTFLSLSKILEMEGFSVIHKESRSGIFEYARPIDDIVDAIGHRKKRFVFDLLGMPGAYFSTLINRGTSMTIVGKVNE